MKIVRAVTAALLLSSTPVMAETIDFDTLASGYYGPSLVQGSVIFGTTNNIYIGTYGTQQLCPTDGGTCALGLNLAFSTAASTLSFTVDGANSNTSILTALVTFGNASTTTLTFTNLANNGAIGFGALSNIVNVALSNDDVSGLSYDNFRFEVGGGGTVPEPASWALMIGGFGVVGGAMRGRRATRVRFA